MHSLLTSEHALRTPCCDPAFFGYRTDSGVFDLLISAASRGAAAQPATQRANSAQQRSQPPSRDLLGVSRLGHEGMPLEKQRRRPFYAVFSGDRLGQNTPHTKGLHLHKRIFVIPIRCLVFSLIVPASEAVEIIVTLSG